MTSTPNDEAELGSIVVDCVIDSGDYRWLREELDQVDEMATSDGLRARVAELESFDINFEYLRGRVCVCIGSVDIYGARSPVFHDVRLQAGWQSTPQGVRYPSGWPVTPSGEPYSTAPSVSFCTGGLVALHRAVSSGTGHLLYLLTWPSNLRLRFSNDGPRLHVSSFDNTKRMVATATTEMAMFVEAWQALSEKVRIELLAAIPELAEHTRYGWWFKGGSSSEAVARHVEGP